MQHVGSQKNVIFLFELVQLHKPPEKACNATAANVCTANLENV